MDPIGQKKGVHRVSLWTKSESEMAKSQEVFSGEMVESESD